MFCTNNTNFYAMIVIFVDLFVAFVVKKFKIKSLKNLKILRFKYLKIL